MPRTPDGAAASAVPMREGSVLGLSAGGFHRVAYAEWGPREAERTVVCAHGLTRNGRDFDPLAEALAARGWRVVCPDFAGRGRSGWLPPEAAYDFPQYLADIAALLARLGADGTEGGGVDWVGTSMGGLAGMLAAALPGAPILRLVLNDTGPFLPRAALERIGGYVAERPAYASIEEAAARLARVHAGFGPLTAAQWRRLAEHDVRPAEGGGFEPRIDPAVAAAFLAAPPADVDLWDEWDRVRAPVLVLRGAESDLLTPETARRMAAREGVEVVEFAGCGHAPALQSDDQIEAVAGWLERAPAA